LTLSSMRARLVTSSSSRPCAVCRTAHTKRAQKQLRWSRYKNTEHDNRGGSRKRQAVRMESAKR
jgi:hypothetical protein